jgi:O-antigen/teichoic acid export membrane protein
VPTYLGIGLYQILTAMDKQVGWTKLMVIAIFVNLGLNSLLIPYFQSTQANGGIGAAIGLLVTEIIIGIFGCRLVGRDVINFQLLVSVLKSLAAALLMGALIWPLRDAPLFVPIIAGMLIYGGLVVAFGLVPLAYLKVVFGLAGRLKQRIIAR